MSESNACLSKSDMEASPPGTLWLIHSKVIPMQLQSFMVRAVFYLILLCSSSLFHLPTALLLPQWLWSSQGAKFVASILGYFLKDGSRGWYWQNTSRGWDIVTNDNLANALWKTVGGPHFPEGTQGIKYQWSVHTYGRARIWDDVVGPQCQEAQHCHCLSCLFFHIAYAFIQWHLFRWASLPKLGPIPLFSPLKSSCSLICLSKYVDFFYSLRKSISLSRCF